MKKLLFAIVILFAWSSTEAQTLKIGVLTDFEKSAGFDELTQSIIDEISRTLGPSKMVQLPGQNVRYDVNSLEDALVQYKELAETSDLVILIGSVSIKGSLAVAEFRKPTIGLGLVDPYLQDIPYENGKSGVENFTYIWAVKDIRTELTRFQEISPFKNLTILVNEKSGITFNQAKGQEFLDSLKNLTSAAIEIVELSSDVQRGMASLPQNTDAVYLSYLDGKTATQIEDIANILIERKIPSFSSAKWHVDNGIMASISQENDLEQVIRKLAIMTDGAINREPLSDMLVNINFKEDLYINAKTIRSLDIGLTFDIYFTANFVETDQQLPTYSLEKIMEIALNNNFGIKITQQDVRLALQEVKSAKTNVMPTLDLGVSGSQINKERANALFDIPERELTGELALNQTLFSERAFAGIKIATYLQKAQEYATQAEILQVLLDTYFDYFSVLAAKTVLAIERENLENFKTNLELARIRVDLGSASRAEILRWESEVAAANQFVVEASTNLLSAKYKLNTGLANTLEDDFDISDVGIDDELFLQYRDNAFSPFVNDPGELSNVVDFLIDESTTNNPNKKFILEQINAAERLRIQNKRVFYVPSLALQAQTQQVLLRGGQASDNPQNLPDNSWSVGVGLAIPIFDANRRKVDYQTSKIQLEQLANTRIQLDQQLELAVRTSVLNVVASSTNIDFSQTSSDNAVANFELVRDKYQAGDISITQLIDAQQAALGAKQRYALAVYDFIQAQLQLEFAVGFFSMFATPGELQEFNDRYEEFRNN